MSASPSWDPKAPPSHRDEGVESGRPFARGFSVEGGRVLIGPDADGEERIQGSLFSGLGWPKQMWRYSMWGGAWVRVMGGEEAEG